MSDWSQGRMVAFDLETTGVDAENDRIVTACVIEVDAGRPAESLNWLADPGIEIPAEAAAVHGVTTEKARAEGRPIGDVVAEVSAALDDAWSRGLPIVIYNAPYDLTLLDRELRRHGKAPLPELRADTPVVDPLTMDRGLDPYRRGSRKLIDACRHYAIAVAEAEAHTSAGDALAAVRLAWRLARAYPEVQGLTALQERQRMWHAAWASGFEDYLSRQGRPESIPRDWPIRPYFGAGVGS